MPKAQLSAVVLAGVLHGLENSVIRSRRVGLMCFRKTTSGNSRSARCPIGQVTRVLALHPGPCLAVGNEIDHLFLRHAIEEVEMALESAGVEDE